MTPPPDECRSLVLPWPGQANLAIVIVGGGGAHGCPDTCGWELRVEAGKPVTLAGSAHHPYAHGGHCGKVNYYLDRVYSPARIFYPLRRCGAKGEGRFERVSWGEALS